MIRKMLAGLLISALLVALVACGGDVNAVDEPQDTDTAEPTDGHLTLTAEFTVFCAEPKYTPAFSSLLNRMKEITGKSAKVVTDPKRITEKKIIVGTCQDERYRDRYRGLHTNDYFVEIADRDTVLIGGGSSADLEKALALFVREGIGESPTMKIGDLIGERGPAAPIDRFLLNGLEFGNYTVCCTSDTLKPLAQTLREEILTRTNEIRPPLLVTSRIPEKPCVVLRLYPTDCNEFSYRIYAEGENVILEGAQVRGVSQAVADFLRESFSEGQRGSVERTVAPTAGYREFCVGDQVVYADGDRAGKAACTDSGLQLKSSEKEILYAGIELHTRHYTDRNGKNVTVHALVCEPGTVAPVCLMPNADYTKKSAKGDVATVPAMAASAVAAGINVFAAINGDFFYMGGSDLPTGYCYHNGTEIYRTQDTSQVYSVFAVLQDNSFYCGSWARLCALGKQNQVAEVVGGRNQLLANGHFTDLGYLSESSVTEFSLDRFTRSAIGYDAQGRIYLVTVDKPGDGTSAGATLTDLAEILLDLGATDAINLDGGGSSTLVVKGQSDDQFRIANVLCVSTPRKIANGIGLILT